MDNSLTISQYGRNKDLLLVIARSYFLWPAEVLFMQRTFTFGYMLSRHILFTLSIILSIYSSVAFGQSLKSYEKYDKVEIQTLYLNSKDSAIRFQVLNDSKNDSKKLVYTPTLTYWWYKSNTILKTTGGADGKLLNGDYVVFYSDNNLKEKGKFLKGLKNGLWISWFPNGKIQEQTTWKKGLIHGPHLTYNKEGNPTLTEKYKKGVLLKEKQKRVKKPKKEGDDKELPSKQKKQEEQNIPKVKIRDKKEVSTKPLATTPKPVTGSDKKTKVKDSIVKPKSGTKVK